MNGDYLSFLDFQHKSPRFSLELHHSRAKIYGKLGMLSPVKLGKETVLYLTASLRPLTLGKSQLEIAAERATSPHLVQILNKPTCLSTGAVMKVRLFAYQGDLKVDEQYPEIPLAWVTRDAAKVLCADGLAEWLQGRKDIRQTSKGRAHGRYSDANVCGSSCRPNASLMTRAVAGSEHARLAIAAYRVSPDKAA